MSALDSIVEWATSELPDWQSDFVRRLLTQEALTDSDRQDALLMLKAIHGLLPPNITPPQSQPLKKGMTYGAPKLKADVILKSVRTLRGVNRIPDQSLLPFGHQGLTAIYGENGSGKSGYARVLKRACRARDTQERILPNVFGPAPTFPAKAKFKVSIDGGPDTEIEWDDGTPSDEVLTNITVFDAKCARVILNEKNEAAYLPYGADVSEELVRLLIWAKQQIEAEKPKPLPLQWTELLPATKSGIFVAGLKHDTDDKDVSAATAWTPDDDVSLAKLTKSVADLEANDPATHAAKVRSFKERVAGLRTYVRERAARLSDERLDQVAKLISAISEATKAVGIASQTSLQQEPLPGVGESAWQILYNAAKSYSTKSAYVEDEFPVVGNESRCVLCMQPLSEDAKLRLLRFKVFMEQAAKKRLEELNTSLTSVVQATNSLRQPTALRQQSNTVGELEQTELVTAAAVKAYLLAIESRFDYFDKLCSGTNTGVLPPLPENVDGLLNTVEDELEKEAVVLDKAVNPAERDKL